MLSWPSQPCWVIRPSFSHHQLPPPPPWDTFFLGWPATLACGLAWSVVRILSDTPLKKMDTFLSQQLSMANSCLVGFFVTFFMTTSPLLSGISSGWSLCEFKGRLRRPHGPGNFPIRNTGLNLVPLPANAVSELRHRVL